MKSEWREVELSNMCSYRQERIEVDSLTTSNYISTTNMLPDKGGIEVAEKLPNTPTTSRFYAGDVLISNIRPYFKKAWLAAIDGGCSNDVLVMKANENVDPAYLYYLLSSDHFFAYMTATSKGTKMPRGDKKAIMMYKAQKPPFITQKAIADTLSCLDAKIEVNNRIIKNLEEQAQAIFKSWFIDFEPFQEGEFVESELGMIPEGWRVRQLGSSLEISTKTYKAKSEPERIVEHYSIPAFDANEYPSFDFSSTIKSNKYYVPRSSFLVSKLNPRFPRIWHPLHLTNDAVCSTEFIVYVPKKPQELAFYYHLVKSDRFYENYIAHASGTTGSRQRVLPNDTLSFLYVEPPHEVVVKFCHFAIVTLNYLVVLRKQNTTLATLRDTLLPKLMSGEIEVPIDQ